MSKKKIGLVIALFLVFLGSCTTLSRHPIGANAVDEPLWNYSQEEVVEKITAANENYALTMSVYPFLVRYTAASVETIMDTTIAHRTEEVNFSFDPEGRLYAMDLEFSLGMGAVVSNDKFRYTPGIIKEYTTLEEKYLALFGDEDERINVEAAIPPSYWKTGYVWDSVPFGNPPVDSNVRISLTSFNISKDHAVPTRTVFARYTRNDIPPPAMGLHEALVRGEVDAFNELLKQGADPDGTILCDIAVDMGNYRFVNVHYDALPVLYYAVAMRDVSQREEIVTALIEAGVDVDVVTNMYVPKLEKSFKDTPLAAAVGDKRREVVKLLLDAGADPSLTSENYGNVTPLEIAESNGFTEIADLIKQYLKAP